MSHLKTVSRTLREKPLKLSSCKTQPEEKQMTRFCHRIQTKIERQVVHTYPQPPPSHRGHEITFSCLLNSLDNA